MNNKQNNPVICQFSCGAASAVATRLALARYGADNVQIVNAYIQEEHPDNRRFLADCEKWFGKKITILQDRKYGASTMEVFRRERFIKSRHGAPCSGRLKRRPLDGWLAEQGNVSATVIFGFTVEEANRFENILDRVPYAVAPLIDAGLRKSDCLAMIERAGIKLPMMYQLGYSNANCIGCPKGGAGYWNKIRRDFPDRYAAMSELQESIGPNSYFLADRDGSRISLKDLDPDAGRHNTVLPDCSFFCEIAESGYTG